MIILLALTTAVVLFELLIRKETGFDLSMGVFVLVVGLTFTSLFGNEILLTGISIFSGIIAFLYFHRIIEYNTH